ncbi:MAG: helix-hairpin-helix domain-containing protein [Weeksellaceae bacterium]|nr:helix-hairpin-helix domain-containing protein [Weeksellaceae bacterium]
MARAFSIWDMTRLQRIGMLVLCSIILALLIFLSFRPYQGNSVAKAEISDLHALEDFHENWLAYKPKERATQAFHADLQAFNPNALDEAGWQDLGFSQKQAASLMRYRYSLGGNFTSSEQIREAFVVSEWKYEQLAPYIQISHVAGNPGKARTAYQPNSRAASINTSTLKLQAFDPNKLDSIGWQKLNFSPRQVQNILKYKNSLPGKQFTNLDQIRASYMISEEKFAQLKPYIRLARQTTSSVVSEPTSKITYRSIDVNTASQEDFLQLGLSKEQVSQILKCRSFKKTFEQWNDLISCPGVSQENLEEVRNYLEFNE